MHLRLSLKRRRRLDVAFRGIKTLIKTILAGLVVVVLSSCTVQFTNPNTNYQNRSVNPQVNEVFDILKELYYEDLPLDLTKIDTLDELLAYVDPYTYVYEADTRSIETGETYVGVGLTIQEHPDGLLVTSVNPLTENYYLMYVGDIITEVDSVVLEGLKFEEKTPLLKGLLGEEKQLKIIRFNQEIELTLNLQDVPFNSVVFEKIGTVGYIEINRFAGTTASLFLEALSELETKGIEALVIDVRDNGGGYLSAVTDILENFVYGEEEYIFLYNVKADSYSASKPKSGVTPKPYPIVTLVNNNSASASEVLAGVLKQFNYPVFGERTFGKDVYQIGYPVPSVGENYYLNLTGGYWLLGDMTRVTGGIVPTKYHAQTGIKGLLYPVLGDTYELGDANPFIETYQYLINMSIGGNYEAGLFDNDFKTMVELYQQANSLTVNGRLDEPTILALVDFYKTESLKQALDNQLAAALLYAGGLN